MRNSSPSSSATAWASEATSRVRLRARLGRIALSAVGVAVVIVVALLSITLRARHSHAAADASSRVLDPTGQLSSADAVALEARLGDLQRTTGVAVLALVDGPPDDGTSAFDATDRAFPRSAFRDGQPSAVVLEIAPHERRARIVGAGEGAPLSAVAAADVVREEITPFLRQGRLRDAIDHGAGAVAKAVADATAANGGAAASGWEASSWLLTSTAFGAAVVAIGLALLLDRHHTSKLRRGARASTPPASSDRLLSSSAPR